jgi:hypothetical protein
VVKGDLGLDLIPRAELVLASDRASEAVGHLGLDLWAEVVV